MLSAGAAERDHQALEAATLVLTHAGVHQRRNISEKLMHALLLVQIIDHRHIFPGKRFESLFASGVRKTAAIENESAAISRSVFRHAAPVKRKTKNPNYQILALGSQLR